jgi:hypothetical protein
MTQKLLPPPESKLEYEERLTHNTDLSGFGFDTSVHMPCPFCAAPDFLIYKVLEVASAFQQDTTCAHCKRTVRGALHTTPNTATMRLFQVAGDDPPPWAPPIPRL